MSEPPAWFVAGQWEDIASDIRKGGAARVHAIEHLCIIMPGRSISDLVGGCGADGCACSVCQALKGIA